MRRQTLARANPSICGLRFGIAALGLFALALAASSCSTNPAGSGATSPAAAVYALDSAYVAAAQAELGAIRSGLLSAGQKSTLAKLDANAYAGLSAVSAVASSGGTVDATLLAAAQSAVALLAQASTTATAPIPAANAKLTPGVSK